MFMLLFCLPRFPVLPRFASFWEGQWRGVGFSPKVFAFFLRVGALGVDSAVFPVVPPSRMSIFGDCGLGFESIVLSKCQRLG